MAIILLIGAGILLSGGSFNIPGLGSTGECRLLKPQYTNYECLEKSVPSITYTDNNGYSCVGGFYMCVDQYCGYPNQITGTPCTVTSQVNGLMVQVGNRPTVRLDAGQSTTANYDDLIKTTRNGGGIRFTIDYKGKYLKRIDTMTGREDSADGCDLSSMSIGYDQFKDLPVGVKTTLNPGDITNFVTGFDDFPIYGNTAIYQGKQVVCETKGDTSATIYELKTVATTKDGSCYRYPGAKVADGTDGIQCCPGDTSTGGVLCTDDFKWKVLPEDAETGDVIEDFGCCRGGLCTPVYCPGEGGFDYDSCTNPPCDVYKYECTDAGLCKVIDTREIACYYDSDCSGDLSCDRATGKCVSKVVAVTCTQAGHECCTEGMFPDNVLLRSCEDAGYPEDYKCVNGQCRKPTEAEKSDGECGMIWGVIPDFICLIQQWWNGVVSGITWFFAGIGILAVIMLVIFIVVFVVVKR